MLIRHAAHLIDNSELFSFDPAGYSQFKFGNGLQAKIMGDEIANSLIGNHSKELLNADVIIVCSSPFNFIPTATFYMKNQFVYQLNSWLYKHAKNPVKELKIHRNVTYSVDYGNLDAKERQELINNDIFHFDTHFINENDLLIFLDDIRITGSHEKVICKMLSENNISNPSILLYYAQLINSEIKPQIENYLNYYSIKRINDVLNIVNSGNFCINTRVVKYVLNSSDDDMDFFLTHVENSVLQLFLDMAIGNEYYKIPEYLRNFNKLSYNISRMKEASKI